MTAFEPWHLTHRPTRSSQVIVPAVASRGGPVPEGLEIGASPFFIDSRVKPEPQTGPHRLPTKSGACPSTAEGTAAVGGLCSRQGL